MQPAPEAEVARRYPPQDGGFALLDPTKILATNEDILKRLRLHAALPEDAFRGRFLGPLERLASHVNVLPASATSLFSGELGLFRASLEMGFYCFQAADGRIFTGQEGVERRHALEGRWRYLCFLAGLMYPLGRTLERVVVTAPDGRVWRRHFGGLTEWAKVACADRIFIAWGSDSQEDDKVEPTTAASALVAAVVGADNLQMLEDGSGDLVSALYELACGHASSSRVAHQLVTNCWDKVARREAARRPQAYGKLTAGTHLAPYLIGALRDLFESDVWKINESALRADRRGMYLVWPEAAPELIRYGRDRAYAGWPDNAPTLAALMKAAGIVAPGQGDLGLVEIVGPEGEVQHALQIVEPLSVAQHFDAASYAQTPQLQLQEVLAADPLVEVEAAAPPPSAPSRVVSAESQPAPSATASLPIQQEPSSDPHQPPEPAPSRRSPPASTTGSEDRPPRPEGKLVEAAEVRYVDLVPEDLQKLVGNPLHVEILGKVVKAWRERGDANPNMRRLDQGAAFKMSFLSSLMRDVPGWVESMAKAGLIHSPQATPGVRIQRVPIPEGRGAVQAVVLSKLACVRLGL